MEDEGNKDFPYRGLKITRDEIFIPIPNSVFKWIWGKLKTLFRR